MSRTALGQLFTLALAFMLAGCASSALDLRSGATQKPSAMSVPRATTPPMLVAMNMKSGALEGWPMRRGGGGHPMPLSGDLGLGPIGGLAANGSVVIISGQRPPQIVLYDTQSHRMSTLPDPFGAPLDVAVGKDGSIYAVDLSSRSGIVTMYPSPSFHPTRLVCGVFRQGGAAIAVDDEGDIFIDGYGSGTNILVGEIPNSPSGPDGQNCTRLPLRRGGAYAEGVAIDPFTDDLITLDNPGVCAGGGEGRVTIYPKPYDEQTSRSHVEGILCSGGLRLNADSTVVFIGDLSLDYGTSLILQRAYPGGGDLGIYHGGRPGPFTTIPNSLPN